MKSECVSEHVRAQQSSLLWLVRFASSRPASVMAGRADVQALVELTLALEAEFFATDARLAEERALTAAITEQLQASTADAHRLRE